MSSTNIYYDNGRIFYSNFTLLNYKKISGELMSEFIYEKEHGCFFCTQKELNLTYDDCDMNPNS